jgi:hypothetical protein
MWIRNSAIDPRLPSQSQTRVGLQEVHRSDFVTVLGDEGLPGTF